MSGLVLPAGATLIASLCRPAADRVLVGMISVRAGDEPATAASVAAGVVRRLDDLLSPLPELLLPGAPVTLLLHSCRDDGGFFLATQAWRIERALRRTMLAALIVGDLPRAVHEVLARGPYWAADVQIAPSTLLDSTTVQ